MPWSIYVKKSDIFTTERFTVTKKKLYENGCQQYILLPNYNKRINPKNVITKNTDGEKCPITEKDN